MNNNNPGCLGIILQFFGLILMSNNAETEKLPYALRDDFLSHAEYTFYKLLHQTIKEEAVVCHKVLFKIFSS